MRQCVVEVRQLGGLWELVLFLLFFPFSPLKLEVFLVFYSLAWVEVFLPSSFIFNFMNEMVFYIVKDYEETKISLTNHSFTAWFPRI